MLQKWYSKTVFEGLHLRDYLRQFLRKHLNYKPIFKGLSGTIFKYHLSLRVDIITPFWRDCFEGLSEL